MSDAEGRGGRFLARWSERKVGVRDDVDSNGPPAQRPVDVNSALDQRGDEDQPPALTDADMPPLESLDEGSDYAGFLSRGVSEELRRQALRKLFQSACFNVADGLDDYAEDFCSFAPLGEIVTADMRHRMEVAAKRLLAEEGDSVDSDEVAQFVSGDDAAINSLDDGDDREDRDLT